MRVKIIALARLTTHDQGFPIAMSDFRQYWRRSAGDRQGRIADGVLVADGRQARGVSAELLARPEVQLVHLRNLGYGCYNFAVRVSGR
jgi:Protein of unknown function (DUF1203)